VDPPVCKTSVTLISSCPRCWLTQAAASNDPELHRPKDLSLTDWRREQVSRAIRLGRSVGGFQAPDAAGVASRITTAGPKYSRFRHSGVTAVTGPLTRPFAKCHSGVIP
jgi:hypothetical protein